MDRDSDEEREKEEPEEFRPQYESLPALRPPQPPQYKPSPAYNQQFGLFILSPLPLLLLLLILLSLSSFFLPSSSSITSPIFSYSLHHCLLRVCVCVCVVSDDMEMVKLPPPETESSAFEFQPYPGGYRQVACLYLTVILSLTLSLSLPQDNGSVVGSAVPTDVAPPPAPGSQVQAQFDDFMSDDGQFV